MAEPLACVVHGALRAQVEAGDTVVVVGPGTLGLLSVGWAAMARPARLVAIGGVGEGLSRTLTTPSSIPGWASPA